jgi:hypothetical protein
VEICFFRGREHATGQFDQRSSLLGKEGRDREILTKMMVFLRLDHVG